jgi:hypothetical protein
VPKQAVLCAEERDDIEVVRAIAASASLGIDWTVGTDGEGIDRAVKSFGVRLRNASGSEPVALVLDADRDPARRIDQLAGTFGRAGIQWDQTLPREGLIITPGGRRVGVWVMPDNASPGALESFLEARLSHSKINCFRALGPTWTGFPSRTDDSQPTTLPRRSSDRGSPSRENRGGGS